MTKSTSLQTLMAVAALGMTMAFVPSGSATGYVSADHYQGCLGDHDNDNSTADTIGAPMHGQVPGMGKAYTCVQTQLWWELGIVTTVVLDYTVSNPTGETPILFEPGAIILADAQACPNKLQGAEVLDDQCFNGAAQQVTFNVVAGHDQTAADCVVPLAFYQMGGGSPPYDVEVSYQVDPDTLWLAFLSDWGYMGNNGLYWRGGIAGGYPATVADITVHTGVKWHNACDAGDGTATTMDVDGDGTPETWDCGTSCLRSGFQADGLYDITRYTGFEL